MLKVPEKVPEPGFYYHYKHNGSGELNNYAYEVMGTGYHTEDDCRPEDKNMVVYRPIYESSVYTAGRFLDIRPLEMFLESVVKDGVTIPRFRKITDPEVITELIKIRNKMYS